MEAIVLSKGTLPSVIVDLVLEFVSAPQVTISINYSKTFAIGSETVLSFEERFLDEYWRY